MTACVAILGSTGSIGTQAIEVCRHLGIRVGAIAAGSDIHKMESQIRLVHPELAVVADEALARRLAEAVADTGTRVAGGAEALLEMVTLPAVDTVLTAVVGSVGLVPTVAAIRAGKRIALANKETLVAAGSVIMPLAREHGVDILPVDSEHSALFQSLAGNRAEDVEALLLTASGGPFRGYSAEQLKSVTREQALKHPNWAMGSKITIDSATMMNKGLEVIEARWLFDVPAERIEVLVHPQSIVHSAVAYRDASIMAQLGAPDMRIPNQLAQTWPARMENPFRRVSLAQMATLTFEKPDLSVFRCLGLAYEALAAGGTAPAVMNAANEEAVAAFLKETITFAQIADVVAETLTRHRVVQNPTLEDLMAADLEGRALAAGFLTPKEKR
jgi:1-deoxy-D-xylulose-5-phosphate reductoisomerase